MHMATWGLRAMSARREVFHIEPEPMTFGQLLHARMEAVGLKQRHISMACFGRESRQSDISAWMRDERQMPRKYIEPVAQVLHLDPTELRREWWLQNDRRKEGHRAYAYLPGPVVGLDTAWAEAIHAMVETFDSPETATTSIRALRATAGPGDPSPDHLASHVALGREQAAAHRERARSMKDCAPSPVCQQDPVE